MNFIRVFRHSIGAAVVAGALMLAPAAANARVFVSVGIAPPAIPVYVQPPCPGYGYIWTPGYWAYGPDGYYWVDGAWVLPPYEDALWTPGYWGYGDGGYFWNPGYWGLTVGYYGGINYGFGYFGTGFYGGYWRDHHFWYNGDYNRFGFRDHDRFVYHQRFGGFDGRPGGMSYARNDGRNYGGRDFNRGSGINGHNFYSGSRGPEQVSYRNGYTANGARPNYGGDRGNGAQFRSGYTGQQSHGFAGANTYRGGYSTPQTGISQPYRGGYSAQSGNAYRGGYNYSAPQSHSYAGGNYGMQARGNYSAPSSQMRSWGGGAARPNYSSGGSFGGGSRPSYSGGGSFGGGGSFHGGGAPSGGSFHGGGGGGGFHGGGGGGSHGGGHR